LDIDKSIERWAMKTLRTPDERFEGLVDWPFAPRYATLVDAACLGYDCVLVEDCAATGSPEYCTQATLYNVRRGFGFVVKADDVIGAIR